MTSKYKVTAEKTGAQYPNHAPSLGLGWQFVLHFPGEKPRAFACHKMAHVFAGRLESQTTA